MGKVKSALEIALERSKKVAAKAGETHEWEEQQYRVAGENMARRYLKGEVGTWDFQSQLERYQGRAREAVEKAASVSLARELSLENYGKLLDGIAALRPDEAARHWIEEARRACAQFEGELAQEEKEAAARWAKQQAEELARAGISGTAIAGFNFRAAPEWQRLRRVWAERLDAVRQRLVEFLAQ